MIDLNTAKRFKAKLRVYSKVGKVKKDLKDFYHYASAQLYKDELVKRYGQATIEPIYYDTVKEEV